MPQTHTLLQVNASEYAQLIDSWQGLWVLVGEVGATLTGLLFVAVSFNLRTIMAPASPGLRRSAVLTFTQFVLLIEIAILFQIPQQSPVFLGLGIAVMAAVGLGTNLASNQFTKSRAPLRESMPTLTPFFIAFVIGLLMVTGQQSWLYVLVMIGIYLLISAVFSAWTLLVAVGTDEDAEPAAESR